MTSSKKTGFFDYFKRALREGLSEAEAYRWAIVEDLWSADDQPLSPEEATADGMCWHPQYAAEPHKDGGSAACLVCGAFLIRRWKNSKGYVRNWVKNARGVTVLEGERPPLPHWWPGKRKTEEPATIPFYWAPPLKIPTRREQAAAILTEAMA